MSEGAPARLSASDGPRLGRWLQQWREFLWFMPLFVLVGTALVLAGRAAYPERLSLLDAWGAPSEKRPFGSAEGGIDVAAFTGHACVRVLMLSSVVAMFSAAIGVPLGALAALRGGRLERLLLRSCDLLQAFPTFLLALAVLSAVETPQRWHLGVVFLTTSWAPFARVAAAVSRSVARAEFVLAAKAMGASLRQLVMRHLIPHLTGPVTVQLGSCAAAIVLSESALGFIGLGPADGVSLGALLEQGTVAMLLDARVLVIASLAVVATSGSLQLASEGLRRLLTAGQRH